MTNPSEKAVSMLKAQAASAWAEFDDEEPLVPATVLSMQSGKPKHEFPVQGQRSQVSQSRRPNAKAKASTTKTNPIVEAARQRTKTTRDLKATETSLNRAIQFGKSVLEVDALNIHGTSEAVDQDPSLKLLSQRLQIALLASSSSKKTLEDCKELYNLCLQDPYMKDLQGSILSNHEGVQTLGYINYVRSYLQELQPTADKVIALMDHQKTALTVISRIACCVTTEANAWKSGVQALVKARKEEEDALRKAELAEQKLAEKRKEKAEKAAQKKAEKDAEKQQKQAEAAEKAMLTEAAENNDDKRKRRVRLNNDLLEDTDPSVLRSLRTSSDVEQTSIFDTVEAFVNKIAMNPLRPAICRLRKGNIKKILSVSWFVFVCMVLMIL